MRLTSLPRILLVCALLILQAENVLACSCGPRPPVLDAYELSEVVMIAKVVSLEKVDKEKEPHDTHVDGVRSATLLVEKVYKGNVRVHDELVFAQGGGGDCIWTFDDEIVGRQLLLYVHTPKQRNEPWIAFGCGRSRPLDSATEDLLYLDHMNRVRGKTRVSGTIAKWEYPDFDVANRNIRIVGEKKTYERKTDANGVFELYDLPPGKYVLEPDIPKGWQLSRFSFRAVAVSRDASSGQGLQFTLAAGRHVSIELSFEPNNAVDGTVVGPAGNPMQGVCLFLLKPDRLDKADEGKCTDENGRFRIETVAPGSYFLVANPFGMSSEQPFPRLFYPGVTEREKAVLIEVGPGEVVKGLNLVISKLAETVKISGVLYFANDKPVVDEIVQFEAMPQDGVNGDVDTLTDSEGRFTLELLKGVKGVIYGAFTADVNEYENCPRLDALIKETGKETAELRTPVIKIAAEQDAGNLLLKFPFPRCKRR